MPMTKSILYGAVLSGGQSSRMGQDKGLLNYHGETQITHALNLLTPLCHKTFVSCRKDQAQHSVYSTLPLIIDQYQDCGALAGLLSLFKHHPNVAWLVLACDMPNITSETLQELITHRDPHAKATAFLPDSQDFPEPLCTLYEPSAYPKIREAYDQNQYGMINLLQSLEPCLIKPFKSLKSLQQAHSKSFENINTPSHYQKTTQDTQR